MDPAPKNNDTPEDVNENASQELGIEQSKTENMEVHHHPHVEKKNLKEYFLEFLMIFPAVTMGFFAENIREHFVNKKKERQYIKSFVED